MNETISIQAEQPASPIASDTARETWLRTGELPTPSADQPADSAPAEPVDRDASTEARTKADSEPAVPAKEKGRSLKERNDALDAEIAELNHKLRTRSEVRRQLEALDRHQPKPDATPADSSPAATTQAEWQRYAAHPDAPKEDAFDRYGDYTAAMSLFIGKQLFAERDQEQRARAQQHQTERQITEKFTKSHETFKSYVEQHPEAKSAIRPELMDIVPISLLDKNEQAGPHHFIAEEVATSPVNGDLLVYFSTKDGAEHWGRLMQLPPDGIVREISRLEGRFLAREAAKTATPPKTISTAPEPPETLGRRPSDPVPDAETALARGDFSAYADAMNRRDFEARRTA